MAGEETKGYQPTKEEMKLAEEHRKTLKNKGMQRERMENFESVEKLKKQIVQLCEEIKKLAEDKNTVGTIGSPEQTSEYDKNIMTMTHDAEQLGRAILSLRMVINYGNDIVDEINQGSVNE